MSIEKQYVGIFNQYELRAFKGLSRKYHRTRRATVECETVETPEAVATKVVLSRVTTHGDPYQGFVRQRMLITEGAADWEALLATSLQKLRYYIIGAIAQHGHWVKIPFEHAYNPLQLAFSWEGQEDDPHKVHPAILDSYEEKLQHLQREQAKAQREAAINEAGENRQLMATLMSHNWLGADILNCLFTSEHGLSVAALQDKTTQDINLITPVLTQLVRFEAVDLADAKTFVCTERGKTVIKGLIRMISNQIEDEGKREGGAQ